MLSDQFLDAIVSVALDGEIAFGSFATGVTIVGDDLSLEIHTLPDHPIAALAGCRAPHHWDAIAIVEAGEVVGVDLVGDCRIGLAMDRSGRQSSEVRLIGSSAEPVRDRRASGLVTDACRLLFRLPTHPPGLRPSDAVAWAWLDRIVDHSIRSEPVRALSEIARLHPCRSGRTPITWRDVRLGVRHGTTVVRGINPVEAAWCDDGAFSRWWIHQLLDVDELLDAARSLLDEDTYTQLLAHPDIAALNTM